MSTDQLRYQLIGECGLDPNGKPLTDSLEEYVQWLHIGAEFLRQTAGPLPQGGTIEVIWSHGPHPTEPFPVIALVFSADARETNPEVSHFEKLLERFDKAVDWKAIRAS